MVLADDLRQAWRSLAKTPGFLALAGSVLALGLAATIFMYAMIDTTIRKPPPFEEAERLIGMQAAEPARGNFDHDVQYLDYLEIRARQRTLEDMMGYYSGTMIVSGDGLPERYSGGFVTWNFMRVLRVKPLLGRDFTAEDDLPHAAPVVILGHDLWRARFGGDPRVVGRTVRVNSRTSTIVGVAPPGFTFPGHESLWIPMARDPVKERRGSQDSIGVIAVGRLAPGTTFTQAADDLAAIAARLAADYPQTNAGTVLQVMPVPRLFVGRQGGQILYTMFAAVWLVLLIACANVASLIFVRANFRVYEASMRVALGARRPRLMMQMLAESVIVAGTGLLGGLALAAVGLYLIQQALAAMIDSPPAWWKFSIDPGIALFGAGAALLSGLLAGIVPAIRASRPNVMNILRDGGRTGTGLRLSRFTTTMVVVEIALSLALLTGAGLMTRRAMLTLQHDIGVDVSGFMSGRVGLPEAAYPPERQGLFFERMVEELEAQPGVLAATAANTMPATGSVDVLYAVDGRSYASRSDYPEADGVIVAPGFFAAFGLPLLQGRDFNSADRYGMPGVAIVNQALARAHFGSASPLGRRIQLVQDEGAGPWLTIVGVVPNVLHDDAWDEGGLFPPTIYQPVSQQPWRFMTVAVRTAGEPHAFADTIRETARRLDPDLAVYWLLTLEEYQDKARAALVLLSEIFMIFAGIAVVLAAVGIYGVLSFATGQRNREIGVRRALGARDRQILLTVMRSAALQLGAGLLLGIVFAPLVARTLTQGLEGMPPDDPLVYVFVFTLLIVVSLVASWVPALRALRVQPAAALRHE